MPKRNLIKNYSIESYYHIYSRGVAKQTVFNDDNDYAVFISLFKRYLSAKEIKNKSRHSYPNYKGRLELLSYCLMPNHIHLLVYQEDERAIVDFMRSLLTSYGMYFNKINKREGPLFQSNYLASLIDAQSYLEHISRYIHLNPENWETSNTTSLGYYLGNRSADWINRDKILGMFDMNKEKYRAFLKDYKDHKKTLDDLKWELADN